MEQKPKFGRFKRRKKANYKKALYLLLVLLIVLYLYKHLDAFLENYFTN